MPTLAESFAFEDLAKASTKPILEVHDVLPPLVETLVAKPSLEDFLPLEDPPQQNAVSSTVSSEIPSPIPPSLVGYCLAGDIAEKLRTFCGLETIQTIFWESLGYQRVDESLPWRALPADVWEGIHEARLLARHEGVYVLFVRLGEGRFTRRWREAVLSQARVRFATAIVLFSDFGWSRVALGWTGEGDANFLKPLRLWPLPKGDRILLAEQLADLRTYHDDDSPRGTLELAESIRRLGERTEKEVRGHDLQEPPVDPDRLYDRLFKECPLMKREETQRLLHSLAGLRPEGRNGVRREEYLRLRDKLLCGHIRLCARVIKHFGLRQKCKSLDWMDLMQEGIFGLAQAIDRFDISQGTKFSTYAFPWIRQAINRAIHNKDRLIRLPAHCWRREAKPLSNYEWRRFNNILSLSVNDRGVAHQLVDVRDNGPSNHLIQRELGHTLVEGIEKCLRAVNRREREILERRFGLGGRKPQTLQEIADIFGLTRERVRQIESRAIERLRDKRVLDRLREII